MTAARIVPRDSSPAVKPLAMPAVKATIRAGRIIEKSSMWRKPTSVLASPMLAPNNLAAGPILASMSLRSNSLE